jgi:murein DD-endopeptidase MepM/ murein hydrolase activator NlpD
LRIDQRRHRRRRPRRLLIAAAILVATVGSVRFIDLGAKTEDITATPEAGALVATPLALPGTTSAAASEHPSSVPAAPLPVLALTEDIAPISEADQSAESNAAIAAAAERPTPVAETPPKRLAAADADDAPSLLAKVEPQLPSDALATQPGEMASVTKALPTEPDALETPPVAETRWVEHTVSKGDSLARIFAAQGLEPALLHRIVNSGKAGQSLARIQPGQLLRFRLDEAGELTLLEHHRSRIEHLAVGIADDEISAEIVSKAVDRRTATAAGVIASSLFVDGQKAGLSDAKIMELAEIFGWDIDFALELRAGDQFRLIYEEHYLNGEKLRDGPILAAEFTNRGETFRAIRYENQSGEIGYYDDTGHSKRRAFLRTPIKFARISSRYNPKRWHPVLKKWRAHKGVDYAAPTGTPIKAAGDGKIVFRGTKGGYGRTVVIQHAGKYTTLYAHMSQYSKRAKSGARVKQGQVIGYVGKSGLATGPHLHYEFRVNGVHKDPLRVKLPKSLSLPQQEIAAFKRSTAPLLAQLEDVAVDTMIASVDAQTSN